LIAAAHAGCFSMATAFQLSGAGHPPESLHTDGDPDDGAGAGGLADCGGGIWRCAPRCPGSMRQIQGTGGRAKANCPVSKVLNATITLEATLE